MKAVDFSRAPFLVIWETTRSCGLACKHCRAEAMLRRDPQELSTEEAKGLLNQTAALKTPLFIFSGGDPLNRPDLERLIRHGKALGLRLGTIPAATDNLTKDRVRGLKDAGLDQIAFSLDGPDPKLHDSFRGAEGSFAKTMQGVLFARETGIPLQINTCFAAWNIAYLEAMVSLVKTLRVAFWEVFFLIPVGRGREMDGISPEDFEAAFARLYRLNHEDSFIVKLTEAQHYRRFVIQAELAAGGRTSGRIADRIRHIVARPRGVQGSLGMSPQAVNAGKGFAFVDHVGNICPSGFLPIPAGNIRRQGLAQVYQDSGLFRDLRNPRLLKGKCGACEFAAICGGSRARAYAATGDYLACDPGCAYVPPRARSAIHSCVEQEQ